MKELAGEHCRVGRVEVSGKGVMTHGTGRGGKRAREKRRLAQCPFSWVIIRNLAVKGQAADPFQNAVLSGIDFTSAPVKGT